jgi:hypothetical protein
MAPVAVEQHKPALLQPACCQRFSFFSQLVVICHGFFFL